MRRPRRSLLLLPAVLFASACSQKQDVFSPEGPSARDIDHLQRPVFMIAGIVGVGVFAAIGLLIRQGTKRRKDGEGDPKQIEGNFKLEIGWTIAPAVLMAIIAVFTVATLFSLDDVDAASAEAMDGMEITVYGHQWWWGYEYETDPGDTSETNVPEVITANDLVIPAGVDVQLQVTSRDVIHSFWIPALAGTRDAVPGRMHSVVLHADEPGIFYGQCKEFCGLSHANMKQRVVALSMAEFQTWFEEQQQPQPMLAEDDANYDGQQLFIAQCARCHQINGLEDQDGNPIVVEGQAAVVARHAPNLTHLMTRGVFAGALFELWVTDEEGRPIVNRNQLEAWIRNAPSLKPMYVDIAEGEEYRGMPNLGLDETQIDQIVDYLLTLEPEGVDGPPIPPSEEQD